MSSNQCTSAQVRTDITKIHSHKVSYTWIIENFHFHEAKDDSLDSPLFSAKANDKYKWYLTMFPNGYSEVGNSKHKDRISLYLELKSDQRIKEVFVKPNIYLLGARTGEVFFPGKNDDGENVWKYNSIDEDDWSWGWTTFATKSEKFRSEFLKNNQLKIQCDLIYSELSKTDVSSVEVPTCDLAKHIKQLYKNPKFADVIISVEGKTYPAHKNILCVRSPFFATMFEYKTKEKERKEFDNAGIKDESFSGTFNYSHFSNGEHEVLENWDRLDISDSKEIERDRVQIEGIKGEEFVEILRYIYTGKCKNLKNHAEGLIAAADKYGLDRLKSMCGEVLFKNLSVENAVNSLILAERHDANTLKNEIIQFIASRFDEVIETEDWKNNLKNPVLLKEVCLALHNR